MSFKRLGDYIKLVDNRNSDLQVTNLLGINITKNFMPSVANVSGTDLSKYKIIQKGQFAYSAMQVGRDETIRLALYKDDEPAIISPAYSVIESKDENELIPEYMMMCFQRPESDRYGWFISDSSVRASLEWERFCEIEIPMPDDIEQQRKYVALYKGLLSNQKVYKNSLEDLQLICDTYIENLIKTEKPKLLVDYVEKLDEKNKDDAISEVVGISERKEFRKPSGKVNKKNLTNHYVVRKNEFGYIPRMNPFKPLAVALSHFDYPVVISASYVAFKIINSALLPEYLFMFLRRSEFDRYAAFNAWSSTRDTFDWIDMCNVKLPIPDIKIQEAIVTIYHTLETRKRINEQLKESIKPLCPVLMKGVVESMEVEPANTI
jgi:type I restriction enzyme S subunit